MMSATRRIEGARREYLALMSDCMVIWLILAHEVHRILNRQGGSVSVAPFANTSVALIIFDCDGVLVDSESISIGINCAMLRENGWDLPREEVIERFLGTSMAHV